MPPSLQLAVGLFDRMCRITGLFCRILELFCRMCGLFCYTDQRAGRRVLRGARIGFVCSHKRPVCCSVLQCVAVCCSVL